MRITCPNCDAQYEVPDEVVPAEGRDVQCSSCGQTWYLEHPDHAKGASEDYEAEAVMPEPDPLVDEPDEDEDYQETPVTAPPRKELDPGVEEILREEGKREEAVRAAESAPDHLETQPDLGLEDRFDKAQEDHRLQEMSERMARMRGEKNAAADTVSDAVDEAEEHLEGAVEDGAGEAAAAAAALGSRRDLLPDIEEINSTLRSTGDRDVAGDDTDPATPARVRKKRSFRRGFMLAVLLVIVLVVLYLMAQQISAAVPALQAPLDSYVGWVDGMRGSLDTRVQSVLKWLDDTAAASANS